MFDIKLLIISRLYEFSIQKSLNADYQLPIKITIIKYELST